MLLAKVEICKVGVSTEQITGASAVVPRAQLNEGSPAVRILGKLGGSLSNLYAASKTVCRCMASLLTSL